MLRCYIQLGQSQEIQSVYEEAVKLIYYNFGTYHPLHANFSSYLASYYLRIKEYELSIETYKKGLNDCLKILGVDHPVTGEFYLDIASVLMKMGRKIQVVAFLEKAFEIYELPKYVCVLAHSE